MNQSPLVGADMQATVPISTRFCEAAGILPQTLCPVGDNPL